MSYKRKGFTLIELLIVVAIIALLASIVLVGLGGFRRQGRDGRRIADLKTVQNGIELYFTKYSIYPGDAAGTTGTDPANWTELETVLVGAGIGVTKIPNDPLSQSAGATYEYGVDTGAGNDHLRYVLKATLETSGHQALRDDVDNPGGGDVFGIDCGAAGADTSEYCVTTEQ